MKKRPIILELSERDVRFVLNALDKAPKGWRESDNTRVFRKMHQALNGLGQGRWVER